MKYFDTGIALSSIFGKCIKNVGKITSFRKSLGVIAGEKLPKFCMKPTTLFICRAIKTQFLLLVSSVTSSIMNVQTETISCTRFSLSCFSRSKTKSLFNFIASELEFAVMPVGEARYSIAIEKCVLFELVCFERIGVPIYAT